MGGGGRVEGSERPSSSVGESVGGGTEEGDDMEFTTHSLACAYSDHMLPPLHVTCLLPFMLHASYPSFDMFGSFYRKCLKV